MSNKKIKDFENRINYTFKNFELLKLALTHSSYGNEVYHDKHHNNERLEFLGDAVLEVTVSDFLFKKYPDLPEGELTKLRASIVCEPTLAICAREIKLDEAVFLGKGEELTGGRFRDSIISDAMEAVLGAIYTDGGIECATGFVHNFILNDIDNKKLFVDSKSILQERIQSGYKEGPEYFLVDEKGPDHCKEFHVEVKVEGQVIGEGKGRTKKAAEQQAAYNAILKMQN
ncbi:MAG: ribonuclease III [Butyrivibrio sp.]